jgi:putative ABC transport system permease protein
MTYLRLIHAQLAQRKAQILITFGCLTVAFLILGLLLSVRQAFEVGSSTASTYRLRTQGASSAAQMLPVHFASRVEAVEGIERVIFATATPAAYQNDPRHLLLQAVPREGFFETFPELAVTDAARQGWASSKMSLVAGSDAAARYGWQLGQMVQLQTNVLNRNGDGTWDFQLVAIYKSDDPKIPSDLTFIRYDYLNDNRVGERDLALAFISTVGDPAQAGVISAAVDAAFETSTPRLVTSPENDAAEKQLAQFGDFGALTVVVAMAVFLSMLLLAHNVWHERAVMRRREFALLKILGFPQRMVVLVVVSEALVVTSLAAAAGMLLAWLLVRVVRSDVQGILQGFHLPHSAYAVAAETALVFFIVSVLWPCTVALRVSMVDVLRGEVK